MRLPKNDRFPVFAVVVVEADAGGGAVLSRTPCSSTLLTLLFHLERDSIPLLLLLEDFSAPFTSVSSDPGVVAVDAGGEAAVDDGAPLDDFRDLRPGKRIETRLVDSGSGTS